jgi:PIN domain nuclease of toxin-antitoxin system
VKVLVDTHALLWFLAGDLALSAIARSTMEDTANELLVSVASLWEMAIKVSLGKLALPDDYETFLREQLVKNDIELLPITLSHTAMVRKLPFYHRDPFDRLLIAQAMIEGIPLVSQDTAFDAYGMRRIG